MTTLIYFFLMSLTLFVIPQIVTKILKDKPSFDANVLYLLLAATLPLIWVFVPDEIIENRAVNFLQHSLGGGVAVGLVSVYFIKTLKEEFKMLNAFVVQVFVFYALVSMLGVANELLEFFLDYFNLGVFSADRYDTWYDLLANSLGAMFVFIMYKFRELLYKII